MQWKKINSKQSSYLARHITVHQAINKFMPQQSGIKSLLGDYKYIDHTHYTGTNYSQDKEELYKIIQSKWGGIRGYSKKRKSRHISNLKTIKKLYKKIDNNIKAKNLVKIFNLATTVYALDSVYLGFGTLYTDYLTKKLVDKYGDDIKKFDFSSKTEIGSYHDELIKLKKIKSKQSRDKKIKEILDRYFWLGSFFLMGDNLNRKQIIKDSKNAQKIIHRKSKNLPNDKLIREMRLLTKDRNKEVEDFMTTEFYYKKILEYISLKYKITFNNLIYCSPDEIVKIILGQAPPVKKIKKRKKLFGFVIKNNKVIEFIGASAKKLIDLKIKPSRQIKGMVAYRTKSKIKGKVKIIKKANDISKVKKGDILVTVMTTPNYIQAIYNSAAIITDEGGITSHASIISRELKKPCIIGTKIATKVLKNGDIILVDTSNGIIKKV